MKAIDQYQISQDKRFEVSKDKYSRKRIQLIKEIFNGIKTTLPFKVGFSLYGSLTKGKNLKKENFSDADIDLSIYVDENDVKNNFNTYFGNIGEFDIEEKKDKVRQFIKNQVIDRLSELGSGNKLTQNIWMYDISSQSFPEIIQAIGMDSSFDESFELRKITRIFHLDVGGGMKRYRKQFFEFLSNQPKDYRDKIWSKIIHTLKLKERYSDIPDKIQSQYPNTFDEAKRYYTSQM